MGSRASWRAEAMTVDMRRLWQCVADPGVQALASRPRPSLRAQMLATLRFGLQARSAVDVLSRRLARYDLPDIYTQDLETDLWLALSRAHAARLPTCVVVALIRVWSNALPTARRFDGGSAPCPCCRAARGDDIRHIAECPALWSAMFPLVGDLQAWPFPMGLANMAQLRAPLRSCSAVASMCLVDVALRAYFQCRACAAPPPYSFVLGAVRCRLLQLFRWRPSIRRAFLDAQGPPARPSTLPTDSGRARGGRRRTRVPLALRPRAADPPVVMAVPRGAQAGPVQWQRGDDLRTVPRA